MLLKYILLVVSLFYISFADQKIIANDGDAGDAFGHNVLLNDSWVVISANEDEPNGTSSGSVYIYEVLGDSLGQEYKIFPSDGEYNDFFGKAIALEGNNLAISSIYDDVNGYKSGSVYIFSYINSEWTQTQKIFPQDGSSYDRFGYSIDINSNFLVVGSIFDDDLAEDVGSVYIYKFIDNEWVLNDKIYPNYVYDGNDFGRSLSLEENYLAVYYKNIDEIYNDQGAVDIFYFDENIWSYIQTISSPDPDNYDYFGVSIDIYDSILTIGANYDDSNYSNTGAVYTYFLIDGSWHFTQKLIPDDVYSNDNFGLSVSIYDGWIAAGSIDDDNGINSGSIYIYSFEDSLFTMENKIKPIDGNSFDQFGNSLNIYENNIVVGAKYDDDLGEDSGSAYYYNFKGCTDIDACNYSNYIISDDTQCVYEFNGFNCDGSCDTYIDECSICGGNGNDGDANQDNEVNIIDIILIVEYILFNTNLNICQIDLNNNNHINITDIILLIENILTYEN